jgi:hypothetical protein
VHPYFIEAAEYQKKVTLLTRSAAEEDRAEATRMSVSLPPDLEIKAGKLYDEMKASGKPRRESSIAIYGLEGLPPGTEISQSQYMLCWLCWFKYNKTYSQLLKEREAGNLKAIKQFHNINLEFDKWQFGHLDPNKLKFKTDIDHFDLMMAGLDLGLATCTAEQLADCFDDLCPCGKEHDPENLKKLRERIDHSFPLPKSGE